MASIPKKDNAAAAPHCQRIAFEYGPFARLGARVEDPLNLPLKARERGFQSIEDDAFRKAYLGLTPPEEILNLGLTFSIEAEETALQLEQAQVELATTTGAPTNGAGGGSAVGGHTGRTHIGATQV